MNFITEPITLRRQYSIEEFERRQCLWSLSVGVVRPYQMGRAFIESMSHRVEGDRVWVDWVIRRVVELPEDEEPLETIWAKEEYETTETKIQSNEITEKDRQ